MSAAEAEAPRARPLSGGLWTLFSWLRRDDHSSSDSLSSVGSDGTAASFAFLGPGHYATTNSNPLVIPPPGPPTDSYKKRVRDRNLRRHNDRDITLLRKYGLHGFDAFSLPNARRVAAASASGDRSERDRRATSELLQRRAHVPGKRRAPPPPPSATSSLTRPRARKRPAPQPPLLLPRKIPEEDKDIDTLLNNSDTLPMNSQRAPHKQPFKQSEVTMGCKPEKYSKKEKHLESSTKEVKPRQDKSFLKQIFEKGKRHSAIETSSVKLLPSISELDKQAHEIIERYKLKELESNSQQGTPDNETPGSSKQVEAWICTRCLKKYNATVITCLYCLPLQNALLNNSCKSSKVSNHATQTNNSQRSGLEDKEKLKEILKEMKDSLPKKPTAETSKLKIKCSSEVESKVDHPRVVEAATLRIGCSLATEARNAPTDEPTSPSSPIRKVKLDKQTRTFENTKDDTLATIQNVLVTQPEVLVHTKDNIVIIDQKNTSLKEELDKAKPTTNIVTSKADKSNVTKTQIASKLLNEKTSSSIRPNSISSINTPLKVSSLFNPIYIPRNVTTNVLEAPSTKEQIGVKNTQKDVKPASATNAANESALPSTSQCKPSASKRLPIIDVGKEPTEEKIKQHSPTENIVIVKKIAQSQTPVAEIRENCTAAISQSAPQQEVNILEKLDQHSRRRNLINQLEQSIAKGDERAAAEAAVKLAQLRLSCSVLSFSSQIVAEASTSSTSSSETPPPKANNNNSKIKEVPKSSHAQTENVTPVLAHTKLVESTAKINTDIANSHHDKNSNTAVEKQEHNQINAASEAVKLKTESVLKKTSQKKDAAVQMTNPVQCAPSLSKGANVKTNTNEEVPILVWVEDKEATRGPVQMFVPRDGTLRSLRRRAEAALGLAARLQRWVVGRALCTDDAAPLVALAGPQLAAPFYLCLVESDTKEPLKPVEAIKTTEEAGNVYNDLVKLEQQAIVSNAEAFECAVCMEECIPGRGVVLRECVHSFCNECLSDVVRHSEEPVVSCPATGCRGVLQEREVRGLVTGDEYEKWLARGLAVAESGTRDAFHCRTRDCAGWALCEPGVRRFPCPVCKRTNCLPCQEIHEGETCEQHRVKLETSAAANETSNQTDEGTRALLEALISRGEALQCPECSAVITKKWGCDWIKCSACKTEICWVTRGRRWGPAGRGDTSAGCRCGLDGNKCHPSCGYCH